MVGLALGRAFLHVLLTLGTLLGVAAAVSKVLQSGPWESWFIRWHALVLKYQEITSKS
jgi:predicted Abi (CAAX) family protease